MTERTASQLAQAIRDAYRPNEPAQVTILPGDKKAIVGLELLAIWLRESEIAREEFNQWRKWKRDNPDG